MLWWHVSFVARLAYGKPLGAGRCTVYAPANFVVTNSHNMQNMVTIFCCPVGTLLSHEQHCASNRDRTCDLRVKGSLLYLSAIDAVKYPYNTFKYTYNQLSFISGVRQQEIRSLNVGGFLCVIEACVI